MFAPSPTDQVCPFIFVPNCELPPISPSSPPQGSPVPGGRGKQHMPLVPPISFSPSLVLFSSSLRSLQIPSCRVGSAWKGNRPTRFEPLLCFPFSSTPSACASSGEAGTRQEGKPRPTSPTESPPPQTGSYTILFLAFLVNIAFWILN